MLLLGLALGLGFVLLPVVGGAGLYAAFHQVRVRVRVKVKVNVKVKV